LGWRVYSTVGQTLHSEEMPLNNGSLLYANYVSYRYSSVDLCVAVATENGLLTPIVPAADQKGLVAISTKIKELSQRARDGKLAPHEYQVSDIFDTDVIQKFLNLYLIFVLVYIYRVAPLLFQVLACLESKIFVRLLIRLNPVFLP
jgi:hypothetical protein